MIEPSPCARIRGIEYLQPRKIESTSTAWTRLESLVVLDLNAAKRANAGIVDKDIKPAHRIMSGLGNLLPAGLARHIVLERKRGACPLRFVDLGGNAFGAFEIDVGDGDFRAFPGEHFRDRFTQPLRAARDQRLLVRYPAHFASSFRFMISDFKRAAHRCNKIRLKQTARRAHP